MSLCQVNLLWFCDSFLKVFKFYLADLFGIEFRKDLFQVNLQIIHFRIDSTLRKFFDFVLNDVSMNFVIWNLFISIIISQNLRDFSQLYNTDGLKFILILEFLIDLIQSSLHFRNIGHSSLFLIFHF